MPSKTTTTVSPTSKGRPKEVYNISNFRATLTTTSQPPIRAFSQTNGMSQPPQQQQLQQHPQQQPQQPLQQSPEPVQSLNGNSTGSSSKVIQRLTADNDRLRRELRAERAAKEDAEEQLRAQKGLFASLQSQTSNLEHIHGNERLLTERKDRRILQLKESLEVESNRRSQAEETAKEALNKFGEVHANAQREVAEAQLAARQAETAYETLRQSYRSLQDDINRLRGKVQDVETSNQKAEERIERISLISDERDKHQASAAYINGQLRRRLDEYQARDERVAKLEREMEDAITAMRWVVRLHGPEQAALSETKSSPKKPTRQPPPLPQ